MSQLIKPLSVRDTVLDISDSIDFAVFKSGRNITVQRYQANSASSTQHIYAIQVPSTSTVISRSVIWGSDVAITFAGTVQAYEFLYNLTAINQANNSVIVKGGDCPGRFLLHQLCTNMSIQINNTNVTQSSVQNILDPILRGLTQEDIQRWYGTTPTQADCYGQYPDALPERIFNAAALAAAVDGSQEPYVAKFNSPFNTFEYSNCNHDNQPRASFQIVSITGNTAAGNAPAAKTCTVTFRVREPIICSPFIFSGDMDQVGMSGLTQINATFTMDSLGTRAMRWVPSNTAGSTKAITGIAYTNAYMEFMQYTPKEDMLIPATCVTPVSQFVNNFIPSQNPTLNAGASAQYTTNSLQLNSIPDKVLIWVDDSNKYVPGTGNTLSDHYATITNVNITFNNQTGILSTFSQEQLYQASLKSGCKQTWAEFSGLQLQAPQGVNVNAAGILPIPTCGSVLYLNFGDVINISELWNAPGSLTTTQFQVQVNATNNLSFAIAPQLNVMFLYSGIISTSNGNSSLYVNGILSRSDTLNANKAPYMAKRELVRYVGSGVLSDLKAMAHNYLPSAKKLLQGVDNKYAKLGADTLDAFGYGKSAGAVSAGNMAGKLM